MESKENHEQDAAEFDPDAWHDRAVWGMEWRTGDGEGDWTSELVLRFDSIVDVHRENDVGHYEIAPAQLIFEDVTDLRIGVDVGSVEGLALQAPMIHEIEREQVRPVLGRPPYRFTIRFELGPRGEISFGASGFTETLLGDPVSLEDRWYLTSAERDRALRKSGDEE